VVGKNSPPIHAAHGRQNDCSTICPQVPLHILVSLEKGKVCGAPPSVLQGLSATPFRSVRRFGARALDGSMGAQVEGDANCSCDAP
jgi:hypothetical protein